MDRATALDEQRNEGAARVEFKVFWGTLLRRWHLLLVALAVTAAATVFVVSKVGLTFEAKGAVLLFPPTQSAKVKIEGNPYLLLDDLGEVRDVVIRAVQSKTTYEDLCAQQGDAAYEAMRRQLCRRDPIVTYGVTPDYTSGTPVILITVDAKSPDVAVTGLHTLMDRVPKALVDLQAGLNLRTSATITSIRLTADRTPDVVYKHQIRAGIVAGAGTLALSLLMIGLFDSLMAVRRRRKQLARQARRAGEPANSKKPAGLKPVPAEEPVDEQPMVAAPLADEAAAEAAEQHVVEPAEQPLVAIDTTAESEAEMPEAGEAVAAWHVAEWPVPMWVVAEELRGAQSGDEESSEKHRDVTRLPERSQPSERTNTTVASA